MQTKTKDINHIIKRRLIALASLVVVLVVLLCLSGNTAVCEWFAGNYSRWYVVSASVLFGWIPFSLYEVSIVLLIATLIWLIVVIIRRLLGKRFLHAIALVLAIAVLCTAVGVVYVSSATILYNREDLPLDLYSAQDDGELDYETTMALAEWFVSELNACADAVDRDSDGNIVLPSISQMGIDIEEEYASTNYLDGYLTSYYISPQYDTFSWTLSQLGITGIFFAPYGEINVNGLIDYATLPATVAHEVAHSKGVMSETDANTVARYLLVNSELAYLRYAGLLQCYNSMYDLIDMVQNDSSDSSYLLDNITTLCYNDIKQISSFWSEYTLLDDVGTAINDIYLKLSGVSDGTDSYNPSAQLEDSGTVDDNGDIVYTLVEYSPTQQVIIDRYFAG